MAVESECFLQNLNKFDFKGKGFACKQENLIRNHGYSTPWPGRLHIVEIDGTDTHVGPSIEFHVYIYSKIVSNSLVPIFEFNQVNQNK